ncbi:MFS transporter [Mycolicibacterium sphagni]|nr:MFS transporter [Mycolicibacterium sphagni]
MPADSTMMNGSDKHSRTWMRSREFLGPLITIGIVQLVAAMDGPVVVFALPKIQNELGLSDAGRSWVVTAYLLTFGGLILLGGRLGDTLGRKRTFVLGVAFFTVASALCAVAWDESSLVVARLLHGVAAAIVAPTCTALLASAFPKGPARNAAAAMFGATAAIGAVLGLSWGGVLTGMSWRLVFVLNVPVGLLVLYLARTMLQETERERKRLDVAGSALATVAFIAAVFGFSLAPEKGWLSPATIGLGLLALTAFVAFVAVERRAENPIVPFNLFVDRSRVAAFAAIFVVSGISFTMTVLIALYLQNIMGYSPLHAGVAFVPVAIAMAVGTITASRLVTRFSPRIMVIMGAVLVVSGIFFGGSNLSRDLAYFPNLIVPIFIGAIGIGMITVPLGLALVGSVGPDRIGPVSAIIVMLQSVGGPVMLVIIQMVITLRTRQLGGTDGPVQNMNAGQLHALDLGYTYGLLCLAGVAVLLAVVALGIGYTAKQVAHAQKLQSTADVDPGVTAE